MHMYIYIYIYALRTRSSRTWSLVSVPVIGILYHMFIVCYSYIPLHPIICLLHWTELRHRSSVHRLSDERTSRVTLPGEKSPLMRQCFRLPERFEEKATGCWICSPLLFFLVRYR